MNELLLLVPAAVAMGVIVYWIFFLPQGPEIEAEPEVVLPSDAELKKMTKAQIEEVAREVGVELDKRMTKANMIADLKSQS